MARKVVWKGDYEITGKAAQSQRGKLEYARNDNKAWFAPEGNQLARNWKRAMYFTRSQSGKLSFQFHDSCVTANTPNTKKNQAAFGANAAVVRGLLNVEEYFQALAVIYQSYKTQYKSFNAWLASVVRPALFGKQSTFRFYDDTQSLTVANPWQNPSTVNPVSVPGDILRKFAPNLAAILIYVDDLQAGAYSTTSASWGVFASSQFNDGAFVRTDTPSQLAAPIMYKGSVIYTQEGEIVTNLTQLSNNRVYTTPRG